MSISGLRPDWVRALTFRRNRTPRIAKALVWVTLICSSAGLLGLASSQPAAASNPNLISFQGKVVNADGTNVSDGTYPFTFKLYSVSSGGSALWTETYTGGTNIQVTAGVFQVELGTLTTLPDFGANPTLYLGITFNNDAAGEMSPRVHLDSVPYALNSNELGGLTSANFVQLAQGLQTDSSTANASIAINKTGGTANILDLQRAGNDVLLINNSGLLTYKPASGSDNATAFTVQNAAGSETLFSVDTTARSASGGNLIKIGNSTGTDTATTILQVDSATADPTTQLSALNGGLFYNSTSNKVKIIENGTVKTLCNTTDLSCGSGTLQQGYTASTGGTTPEIKLDNTRGGLDIQDADTSIGANLFNIRASNGSGLGSILLGVGSTGATTLQNSVNSTNAFQIQNAAGTSELNVGTISQGNLLTNGSFESNTSGWSKYSGNETTFATSSSNPQDGSQSLNVVTPATTTNDGTKYTYNFQPNTTYTFSTYAMGTASFAKFDIGANVNGSDISCNVSGNNLFLNTSLTRYTCTFTTGAPTTGSDYVFLRRNSGDSATARTLYFDSAQLEYGSSASAFKPDIYPNLIGNPDLESNANGWSVKGTATSVANSSNFAQFGNSSLKVVTGTAANNGTSYSYSFQPSSRYSLSLWARIDTSTTADINIGRQDVSGTDVNCLTGQTLTTTWTQFTCTFTTGATITPPSSIYLKQTGTTSHNLYIDGVTLIASGSPMSYSSGGQLLNVDPTYSNITLLGTNDGSLGPWQTNANALPAVRQDATSVVANGYIYELGGYNGTNQSTVYYAKLNSDGSVGSWSTASNGLPVGLGTATSVVANGYVYVIGGAGGSGRVATVYYAKLNIDGSVGSWQTANNSLPAVRSDATSVVANGYVYVIGGADNSATQQTVYYAKLSADGSVGSWSAGSNVLPLARKDATSVVANGYVYEIGGNATATVYYAKLNSDGSTGSWSTASNPLPVNETYSASVVSNGYVYEIGGDTFGATGQSTVYYAKLNSDGSVGSWSTAANALPAARWQASSVVANGYVYEIGGDIGTLTTQSTVYYASTSRIKIGGNLDLVGLQGQDLADGGDASAGSTGGSITAGNITAVGSLQVQGPGSFASGVAITKDLTVGGSVTFKNTTDSLLNFGIQNGSGVNVFKSSTINLVKNSNFETGPVSLDGAVDGWAKKGSTATLQNDNSTSQFGSQSMQFITTTAAQDGVKYPLNLAASTQYTLSFYAKVSTGSFATLTFGRSDTGSGETDCVTTGSITTAWTRFNCTFTTGSGAVSGSYLYISHGADTTARTINVDGVQLEAGATMTDFRNGDISVDALTTIKSTSGSASAFQIQNPLGNTVFGVDTSANQVLFGKSGANGGSLVVYGATSGSVTISVPSTVNSGANYNLVLPSTAGSASQCLQNSGTPGILQWGSCGGTGQTRVVTLVPEYPGAVTSAVNSPSSGTMTSDYDGTNKHNYYQWLSGQSSLNSYDVVLRTQIPSEYSSSFGTFKIWAYGDSNSTSNNDIKVTVRDDTSSTTCVSSSSVLPGTGATWTQQPVSLSGCSSFAANDILSIDIQMLSLTNNKVRIGEISYQYSN